MQLLGVIKWGMVVILFKIVQIDIPDNIANNMHIDPHLDGIGPARYADVADLNNHSKVTWSQEVKTKSGC